MSSSVDESRTSPVTIVTGAAQGIGKAIAGRLISEGAEVTILDISAAVEPTATEIGATDALRLDITDIDALQKGINKVAARHGRLDVLVNCAGTCGRESFEDLNLSTWRRDLDTNLTAAVGPVYRDGTGGRSGAAYASAKAGAVNLTR